MIKPKASDLLIAPPSTPDRRFRNTVMMLTHDHDQGSFALCVNRLSNYTLQDLVREIDMGLPCELNFPLYWGGPMSPTTIWMLHSGEWQIPGVTVVIDDQWSMTSNLQMFNHIAERDYPRYFRISYGYCSWATDQLMHELQGRPPWRPEHAWLVANNLGPEWLFEQPVEEIWTNSTTLSGHQAVDSWF